MVTNSNRLQGGGKKLEQVISAARRKVSRGHALGMFSLACCLMRFLEGATSQYSGVARVRGKKATHSYAALSFLCVRNTRSRREEVEIPRKYIR